MREEILSGRARPERKLAVCAGTASLEPVDRVELLAVLASDGDAEIAGRAASALLTQPIEAFLAALERADTARPFFAYCAANLGGKPGIADAMARNSACPAECLATAAHSLSAAGLQTLLDNLERLTSSPSLIASVAGCPALNLEQRELLEEMQRGTARAQDLEDAVSAAEPDPAKRQTLLQRLSRMNVVERVHLALRGNREERMALIRDPNKVVQRAVLQSPRLTDMEVESFAAVSILSGEILRAISLNRAFLKNYAVARNLLNNPKTPLDVSLHLLPRLTPKDLKLLGTNKNIPETLRSTAFKLDRKRTLARQES